MGLLAVSLPTAVPRVADVAEIEAIDWVPVKVPLNTTLAVTFQLPAVKEIEVTLAAVLFERVTALPDAIVEDMISPTNPAGAAVLVLFPLY